MPPPPSSSSLVPPLSSPPPGSPTPTLSPSVPRPPTGDTCSRPSSTTSSEEEGPPTPPLHSIKNMIYPEAPRVVASGSCPDLLLRSTRSLCLLYIYVACVATPLNI
uniref:Uncharacterized protein n=1 Tax=Zea mays TaxID=4577 RepID=A0A804QPZ6_MAIZE